jgi:hypothetical protein
MQATLRVLFGTRGAFLQRLHAAREIRDRFLSWADHVLSQHSLQGPLSLSNNAIGLSQGGVARSGPTCESRFKTLQYTASALKSTEPFVPRKFAYSMLYAIIAGGSTYLTYYLGTPILAYTPIVYLELFFQGAGVEALLGRVVGAVAKKDSAPATPSPNCTTEVPSVPAPKINARRMIIRIYRFLR